MSASYSKWFAGVQLTNTTQAQVVTIKRVSFNLTSIFFTLNLRCNSHYLSTMWSIKSMFAEIQALKVLKNTKKLLEWWIDLFTLQWRYQHQHRAEKCQIPFGKIMSNLAIMVEEKKTHISLTNLFLSFFQDVVFRQVAFSQGPMKFFRQGRTLNWPND